MPNEEMESRIEEIELQETTGKKPKPSKKTVLRYVINILVVLIATGLALFFTLRENFFAVIDYLKKSDIFWILIVFGMMVLMIIIRGIVLYCFARLYTRKYHLHQALAVDQIGVFYNAVTPGASGGEIMEAYTYKKQGLPISSAVSIMAMYSIIFQSVLIIYGIISFIFKGNQILNLNDLSINLGTLSLTIPMWLLTIIGFVMNIFVILGVVLMAYWKGFHKFVMGPMISLLAKLRIFKDPDKKREQLRVQVENFKIEFRRLLTNIPFTILIALLFFAYFTVKFSIPYFVGKALGNVSEAASFWDSIFLSNYHQMVAGIIPIPGSAGVSEYIFYELFMNKGDLARSFFVASVDGVPDVNATESMTQAALLVWRSLTFAFPIIIAGFVTAFYKASPKSEVGRHGEIPDRDTFTELQAETLAARSLEVETLIETQQLTIAAIRDKLRAGRRKKKNDAPLDDETEDITIDGDDS